MIRIITGGESHGKALVVIIEGFPAGVKIEREFIDKELLRRQKGYGRGNRMKIEKDKIEIISGIRGGKTIGSPITFLIKNLDYDKWEKSMNPFKISKNYNPVLIPRPGHADLAGIQKYKIEDIRDILERASARETASKVAAGGLFKIFLKYFGISIYSHTLSIGDIKIKDRELYQTEIDNSPLRCVDSEAEKKMLSLIDKASKTGDSLGGISEIIAKNIPVGLGSHISFNRRIDAKIGEAMLSIPSVKGVEIGSAFENTKLKGSMVHDEIFYDNDKGFFRKSNNAGGIEGGITNGENIIVRIAIKPIPTLMTPLKSINIKTKRETKAHVERADTCIVPAAGVIGESMLAYVLSDLICEKFGSDNISDIKENYEYYMRRLKNG
jgi:chorismate synthase